MAITESDLYDWAGLWVNRVAPAGQCRPRSRLAARLSPRPDGQGLVKSTFPRHSPVACADDRPPAGPAGRERSDLQPRTPCQLKDISWIRPGMMAWDHWWTGDVKMDTATIKEYIQLAADMGWPYQLIDWQWYGPFNKPDADITKVNPAVDMDEVRRFAKEKGVRLWLWLYWTDADRNNAYQKAFELYEQWGIAGVKIDFMNRDDQDMVNWYEKLTRAAAEHHLMIIFHGAFKPTGMIRTFPNQVTREGILGNEYNRWSTRVTPEHKLTLPFTRFLAGPADFTPGGFLNRQPGQFKVDAQAAQVQGTRCAELALFVVYDSPVCCVCDHPSHYRDQPGVRVPEDRAHRLGRDPRARRRRRRAPGHGPPQRRPVVSRRSHRPQRPRHSREAGFPRPRLLDAAALERRPRQRHRRRALGHRAAHRHGRRHIDAASGPRGRGRGMF